ncbi:hypothetical protein DPMN_050637 [Dreissena polymorpha]|uniref:Uncharacterized protein n=1 Tax=Dreissena polymorpha TaxID=45954 RepID=A0A9D4HN93_DREPO|nr:hypothetical protein DPMN_050637 [Dreissena polymorpha]
MRFMDEDMFEDNLYVDWLSLYTNQFRRIPSGLNTFKNLRALQHHRNLIENVDDNDLIELRSLTTINLAGNQIQFITNKAFQNNIHLTAVDLSHTFLTTIPAAVTMLPSLETLGLEANYIECTCDLASLKNWNVSSIRIDGLCYLTEETIEHCIKNYIDAGKC